MLQRTPEVHRFASTAHNRANAEDHPTETVCPCCGSSVTRPFIVDLGTNTIATPRGSVSVPPYSAEVASVLAEKFPSAVPKERIISRIYGARSDMPEAPLGVLNTHLCHLRRSLAGVGLGIETLGGGRSGPASLQLVVQRRA